MSFLGTFFSFLDKRGTGQNYPKINPEQRHRTGGNKHLCKQMVPGLLEVSSTPSLLYKKGQ